jgi:hypothetical protein
MWLLRFRALALVAAVPQAICTQVRWVAGVMVPKRTRADETLSRDCFVGPKSLAGKSLNSSVNGRNDHRTDTCSPVDEPSWWT